VPQNYTEALKWYRLAASQGNAQAQCSLGLMFYNGHGVLKDYGEAVKWYRLAATQGDAAAQGNLGLMFENGKGVPQDYVSAHMWFNLAASRFSALEEEWRDKAVKERDRISAKMTQAQIAEAQRRASEWKPSPK
jgi:TPR repeat protein